MNTRMFRRIGLLSAFALVCAGEQPPESNQPAPEVSSGPATAVFRSSTNLVQVPVVVRDRSGYAVGSLRAEDFQLLDSGKAQVISRFSVEKFDTSGNLQNGATSSDSAGSQPGPAAPGVAAGSLPDRFVAMLIDDENLEPADFIQSRNAALRFIAAIRPDERVAIVTTSGSGKFEFTNDRDQLRKTLLSVNSLARKKFYDSVTDEKLKPCPLSPYIADLIVNTGRMMTTPCLADDKIVTAQASGLLAQYSDPDALAYFRALTSLIGKMSGMPGQRAVLLASPGMYVPKRFERQLTGVLSDAIRTKVVISGIDPRGVLEPIQ